jgi:hypothetical protein
MPQRYIFFIKRQNKVSVLTNKKSGMENTAFRTTLFFILFVIALNKKNAGAILNLR